MLKLSDAWKVLRLFGVDPRDAQFRADARYLSNEYLVLNHPDQDSASDAQDIVEALDVVEARLNEEK